MLHLTLNLNAVPCIGNEMPQMCIPSPTLQPVPHLQPRQVQLPELRVAPRHDALHLLAVFRQPHAHIPRVGQPRDAPEQILTQPAGRGIGEGGCRNGSRAKGTMDTCRLQGLHTRMLAPDILN